MRETIKYLQVIFTAFIAISVILAALWETNILNEGILAGEEQVDFAATTCMELITVCSIPIALKLFKWKRVVEFIKRDKAKALRLYGTVRIFILGIVMMANTILYYMLMNTTMGYLAIITLIAMAFIVPTRQRCEYETSLCDKEEESGK